VVDVKEALSALRYSRVEQRVSARDAILYALSLGFGEDPLDPHQLRYVYEEGLQVIPTMAVTLCYPGVAEQGTPHALDMRRVFHVFQRFELHAAIPLDRRLVGQTEVTGVHDKGAERGLVWTYRNNVRDADSGALICVLDGASMTRDGGTGEGAASQPPPATPARAPDAVCDIGTLPQAALIYRLSGDYNPLHVDPQLAREGGFDRPILHGRCTFGVAGRALVQSFGEPQGAMLASMEARFSAPVFPGETLRTEMWQRNGGTAFRVRALERNVVVLDHGLAQWR
jgi:acyl dehydratase